MDKKTLSKYRCFNCIALTYTTEEYAEIMEHCAKGIKCRVKPLKKNVSLYITFI
ncbi:hypothetical protein DPMN_041686 [Dreissena polymorpha]|uniref:Uncharacterized protein n=1 Tax=Dreissena polymorpha TaxID=45954 RepID=A0A9D4CZ50_DREPO|nr:hypothetical protein DPMN_041686 [Dreissena polymorpha]